MSMTMLRCRICAEDLPETDFSMNGKYRRHECNVCRAAQKKAAKLADPRRAQDLHNVRRNRYMRKNPALGNAKSASRRAAKLQRTPQWLTAEHKADIRRIYRAAADLTAATGESYHVDHIVPLQGENVSGLHVPWNLQVLRAIDNLKKSNRHE
jgi:hypothetical protein